MNKFLTSSLLIAGISGTAQASFDDAFKNITTSGQLRFGYISVSPDVAGNPTTTGAAIGGELNVELAKWGDHQFVIAPYFVEKIGTLSGDSTKLNTDFFNSNNEGYAYLGEIYLNHNLSNEGYVRLGRQKIDTPFINTDDIRMFSNTFNGIWLSTTLSDTLTLDAGYVATWAGFDSGTSAPGQDKFKKASNEGVTTVGLNYKQSDALSTQAWYYNFDQKYSLLYADVTYSNGGLELAAQAGNYTETKNSGTAGTVLGVSVSYTTGPFTLAAVANSGSNPDGKSADLGLGGGNYYAAMDEMTIGGLNDAQARVISVIYDASEKFSAGIALGHFEDSTKATKTDETDLVLSYNMTEILNFELIHTTVDNKGTPNDADTNFSRQTARVTYSF